MYKMKKILALAFFALFITVDSNAQVKFGVLGSLYFDGSFFGVGGRAHNSFSEDISGQGSFTYFLKSGGTFWAIDADVLYHGFDIGDVENFSITPFAGLNIFSTPGGSIAGISFGGTNTGINLGVSATKTLGDSMELFIEPKLIIGNGGNFAVTGGIYF